jgi:hypothetical protein
VDRRGTIIVRFDTVHFLQQFSRNTLKTALEALGMDDVKDGQETGTGFIQFRIDDAATQRVRGITIEMLDPRTMQPMDRDLLSTPRPEQQGRGNNAKDLKAEVGI